MAPLDPAREPTAEEMAQIKMVEMGMDMAVQMARSGNLRLYAMEWEREAGDFAHSGKIKPWKITVSAWKAWWWERRVDATRSER